MPLAVLAVKAAGTFSWAFGPKMIPAGFNKNRLDGPPVTWRVPLIIEALPPVTRPRMFWIFGLDWKLATCPAFKPNWPKLWNRLPPDRIPLLISIWLGLRLTWV